MKPRTHVRISDEEIVEHVINRFIGRKISDSWNDLHELINKVEQDLGYTTSLESFYDDMDANMFYVRQYRFYLNSSQVTCFKAKGSTPKYAVLRCISNCLEKYYLQQEVDKHKPKPKKSKK